MANYWCLELDLSTLESAYFYTGRAADQAKIRNTHFSYNHGLIGEKDDYGAAIAVSMQYLLNHHEITNW